MYKYGVRLLKNRLYPVKMPKNCEEELQHGQMVLITTEKGQEVAKILRISQCVFLNSHVHFLCTGCRERSDYCPTGAETQQPGAPSTSYRRCYRQQHLVVVPPLE